MKFKVRPVRGKLGDKYYRSQKGVSRAGEQSRDLLSFRQLRPQTLHVWKARWVLASLNIAGWDFGLVIVFWRESRVSWQISSMRNRREKTGCLNSPNTGGSEPRGWIHLQLDDFLTSEERRRPILAFAQQVTERYPAAHSIHRTGILPVRLIGGEFKTNAASPLDYMIDERSIH
jgi:hypothetical protein